MLAAFSCLLPRTTSHRVEGGKASMVHSLPAWVHTGEIKTFVNNGDLHEAPSPRAQCTLITLFPNTRVGR